MNKMTVRVFEGSEQAVHLTLEGLYRDGWISTSVLTSALYDRARYEKPRYCGKSRIVRCELVSGKKVVVVICTPTNSGKMAAENRGEKVPEWIPNGAVTEFEGKLISLAEYRIGPVAQWTQAIPGHDFIELYHTSQTSQRDKEYLLGHK